MFYSPGLIIQVDGMKKKKLPFRSRKFDYVQYFWWQRGDFSPEKLRLEQKHVLQRRSADFANVTSEYPC